MRYGDEELIDTSDWDSTKLATAKQSQHNDLNAQLEPICERAYAITKTLPCNIQRFFTGVKTTIFI